MNIEIPTRNKVQIKDDNDILISLEYLSHKIINTTEIIIPSCEEITIQNESQIQREDPTWCLCVFLLLTIIFIIIAILMSASFGIGVSILFHK